MSPSECRIPWTKPVALPSRVATIHLSDALLCVECEAVFSRPAKSCPDCGDTASVGLAKAIGLLGPGVRAVRAA